jgi:high-affinity K+ transport system ATPase subunit B
MPPSKTGGLRSSHFFNPIKLKKRKMKKFSVSEMLILVVCVVCIFVSEYIYLVQDNILKAIFIGLWPPTILGLLNFINIKRK